MSPSFLIVDDSAVIRMRLVEALVRQGVKKDAVREAKDAEEGLNLFGEKPADIVFMDMTLPGQQGDEAAMKMLEQEPTTRVVIVTAKDPGDEDVRRLVSMGAFAVLSKPVRGDDMRKLLSDIHQEESGAGRIR